MLVRGGADARLPRKRDLDTDKWIEMHTVFAVYREMFFQVCRDYSSLPDPRSLRLHEIRAYYDPLRGDLREHTKPKKK